MTALSQSPKPAVGRPTEPVPLGKIVLVTLEICLLLVAGTVFVSLTPILPIARTIMSIYDPKLAWYFTRAAGIVAYVLLSISMIWGLILSTKISKEYTPAPVTLALHNAVSWVAFGIGVLHALALLMDTYYTYSLLDIVVPFVGPYRAMWVGLGIVSLYIMLLSSASFAWVNWLGKRGWVLIHFATYPMYGLVTLHGLMSGTDSGNLGAVAMYAGSLLSVLFLTNYRIIAGKQAVAARRNSAAAESASPD